MQMEHLTFTVGNQILQLLQKCWWCFFDGTANINLPGVNTSGDHSGNATTATALATARTINGTSFDGSAPGNL